MSGLIYRVYLHGLAGPSPFGFRSGTARPDLKHSFAGGPSVRPVKTAEL